MTKNPIISIIVPSYNVEKYIERFFESILRQTCKNFELIFVNDASTDQTGKICEEYAMQHDFVRVFHNSQNGGLSVARNVGLDHAVGKYISFIDPDDAVDVSFIEKMYGHAVRNNCDIVVCGVFVIYKEKPTEKIVYDFQTEAPDKNMIMQLLFEDKIASWAWNKMYKRELWEIKRFMPGRVFGEDIAIMHEIFDSANRIGFITESLCYYYMNEDSLSFTYRPFKWMSLYLGFKDRLEFAEKKYPEMTDGLQAFVLILARHVLDNYLINKDKCDELYLNEIIGQMQKGKQFIGKLPMKQHQKLMIRYYNFSPKLYTMSIKLIHWIFYLFFPNKFRKNR